MRTITSSPHIHSGASTQDIMFSVTAAMTPSVLWGIYSFGFRAFLVMFVSIFAALLTEFILGRISNEFTLWDGSALVTGMLVGMNMSSTVPLFIPALASFFAIAVAKWTFGGLGANWANPAIAGRVFVFFSFSSSMSEFVLPRMIGGADFVSSATPMSLIKTAVNAGESMGMTSLEILKSEGFPVSQFASKLGQLTGINPYNIDAFIGNIPGCIGEVSAVLLIAGAIYLFKKRIITWHIPLTYLGTYAVFTWIFGGIPYGLGLFNGEAVASMLRGGLILAVFYMATDMVTCPISRKGQAVFGIGCGFFTFLFRYFGSLPEAASVAILIMNMVSPTIDKFVVPRVFGTTGKKGVAK